VTYLDTGCLVKLYYPEPQSPQVIAAIAGKPVCFTPLHELEFVNALHLKVFAKSATTAQVASARALVEGDLRSGVLVVVGAAWDGVFRAAVELAERHTGLVGCRSLDILHCALAKTLAVDEFITTDARQKQLASMMGLALVAV
jgi:predicted nucleic acid-binding protein